MTKKTYGNIKKDNSNNDNNNNDNNNDNNINDNNNDNVTMTMTKTTMLKTTIATTTTSLQRKTTSERRDNWVLHKVKVGCILLPYLGYVEEQKF